MKSDGGLCQIDKFTGYVSIISGPAGGVNGYSRTTAKPGDKRPVVGCDMGGTSTDVSRVHGEEYLYTHENEVDGVEIHATQLLIDTIAAGGGSILFYKKGYMDVGPDSVGSNPGPMCYGKGSKYLAITDANVLTGRIITEYFPFKLHLDKTREGFEEMARRINEDTSGPKKSIEEVAMGFIKISNSKMSEAIKKVTEQRGHDVTEHILSVFGGAGPQHACAIARELGITTISINR